MVSSSGTLMSSLESSFTISAVGSSRNSWFWMTSRKCSWNIENTVEADKYQSLTEQRVCVSLCVYDYQMSQGQREKNNDPKRAVTANLEIWIFHFKHNWWIEDCTVYFSPTKRGNYHRFHFAYKPNYLPRLQSNLAQDFIFFRKYHKPITYVAANPLWLYEWGTHCTPVLPSQCGCRYNFWSSSLLPS